MFIAFSLMVAMAYFVIGRILSAHLVSGTNELLSSAEANVRAAFSETENALLNSHFIVQGMVEREAEPREIFDYLTNTTEWMRRREQGLIGFYGVYGYINGEFYDSIGLNPGGDFIPQTRPWYQTAQRIGAAVGYTPPYMDMRTGNTTISAVKNIDGKNGGMAGTLSLDININWLIEYMRSLKLTASGYGMLLNQDMILMAHPNDSFPGRELQELSGSYERVARMLRSGEDVYSHRMLDFDGASVIVFFKRIFNVWYVGIVTPQSEFYRDLYVYGLLLVLMGLVFSLLLCYILLRISEARMRADIENRSKSTFLASMSHEIRTPMNAITGMAELLLRGELSDEARSYAQDIKQAGNNLISIINDILDFSKIEAGKLEILPVKYLLASLVNDTINIIRIRIGEKPLRFHSNIDGSIPSGLVGDEVRLRQILLNLLSNAVKYSEKGHISLSITTERRESKQVWLKFTVTDTGKGIKPEDQEKLFSEFVQVDLNKNRGIEGTGLGLAITRRLCVAMGGDISVASEYGKGSTFTAIIPQGIGIDEPFAVVENAANKKVLVYERRVVYSASLCWSLENMKVPHTLANKLEDFSDALYREEWFFVFSGYGLYEQIRPFMEKDNSCFAGGKKPPLALMVEWGTEAYIPDMRLVSLPVQSLSIANILNGKMDSKGYTKTPGETRLFIPKARILVVDDMSTNLKVAEGLLAVYKAKVDTCLTGREAIEMVKLQDYDIIFMDHMMPEMDGIETTAAIRAWEKERVNSANPREQLTIIALTANAVVGMREMFIEKGFNGFLAKPIDVSKLEEILDQWIPNEKREIANEESDFSHEKSYSSILNSFVIQGVNTQHGIAMTGGTVANYRQVLALFRKDAEACLSLLQTAPTDDTLSAFITQVHALKSASASIGAAEVAARAAELEAVGKDANLALIGEKLNGFAEQLAELVKNIDAALELPEEKQNGHVDKNSGADTGVLTPVFMELIVALKSQKTEDIDTFLEHLTRQAADSKTKEILEQISDQVLIAEYENAVKIIDGFINNS